MLPEYKEAWFFPTLDSIKGMGEYVKVALLSMVMLCLEWWSYEIQILYASFISVEAVGSQVIILNLIYIYFTLSLGI
jgi:MATE family multidrug resistance protein